MNFRKICTHHKTESTFYLQAPVGSRYHHLFFISKRNLFLNNKMVKIVPCTQVYIDILRKALPNFYNEMAFFSLRQSINRPTLVYICYYANENIFYSYTGGTSFIYSFSHFTPLNLGYSYILFRVAKNFICSNTFLFSFFVSSVSSPHTNLPVFRL